MHEKVGAIVGLIIGISVSIFLVAYLIPTPLKVLGNGTGAYTGSVNAGVFAITSILLPLLAIVAIALMVFSVAMKDRR